jgi:hypothetical protein
MDGETRYSIGFSIVAIAVIAAITAGATEAAVRPGVGIGKVRLGMTQTQVRAALGKPSYIVKRERRGFGTQYIEFGWNQAAWTVAFHGRPGRLRSVKVATTLPNHRARRVGTGSIVRAVVNAFPAARCRDKWLSHRARNTIVPSSFQGRWLIVGEPGGRHSAFVVGYRFDSTNSAAAPPLGHVAEVVVQEPAAVGNFISTACPSGWRRDAPPARPNRYGRP